MDHTRTPHAFRVLELDHWTVRPAGRFLLGTGAQTTVGVGPDPALDRAAFAHWHAGKTALELGDHLDVIALAEGFDVVLRGAEGPEVAAAVELGAELRAARPDLIDVVITPFGIDGPWASQRADDFVVQAAGGLMTLTGTEQDSPIPLPYGQAAHVGGLNAALGVYLALLARRRDGLGQQVDISLQECTAATTDLLTPAWIYEGRELTRLGERHPLVPHGLFRARDGVVAGGLGGSPKMWDNTLQWLVEHDAAGELVEERWADPAERMAHREVWETVLQAFIETMDRDEFVEAAQDRHLPWAPILRPDELVDDPQLRARRHLIPLEIDGQRVSDIGFAASLESRPRPLHLEVGAPTRTAPSTVPATSASPRPAGTPGCESESVDRSVPSLAGIRVLDLTWVLAGPYATRILADHGAEVIKVESVHRPDPTRFSPTLRYSPRPGTHHDESGYFNTWNRNKRSVALNLRSPDGIDVLRSMIATADVVIDNFSAGVMQRWGLDYSALRALREDVIWVSMSGMGQHGPRARYVAYADIVSGFAGLTHGITYDDGPPVGTYFGYADMIAGYHAALCSLAALEHRRSTGRGQHVDLSQVEAMASQVGPVVLRSQLGDPPPPGPTEYVVRSADSDVWVAASPVDAPSLCEAIGTDPLTGDELERAFTTWAGRTAPRAAVEQLQGAGIPAAVVAGGRALVEDDPQLRHRAAFRPVTHPLIGTFPQDVSPVRLDRTPATLRHGAPLLGADTDDVLSTIIGLSHGEITRLRDAGTLE